MQVLRLNIILATGNGIMLILVAEGNGSEMLKWCKGITLNAIIVNCLEC